jgi:hypothetical protein
VLLGDEHVRVLQASAAPSDTVPVHTHRWPSVLRVLGMSEFPPRDLGGTAVLDTRDRAALPAIGSGLWSAPLAPDPSTNVASVTSASSPSS